MVTKEEFMDRVWGGTVVTLDVLSRCISELRKIFGDDASNPHYIETIRKTGYRLLVSPVFHDRVPEPPAEAPDQPLKLEQEGQRITIVLQKHVMVIGGIGTLAALLLLGLASSHWLTIQSEPSLQSMPFTTFPGIELDPAISPDGEHVAFAWNGGEGNHFDLYLKQIGGETPLRLTAIEGNEQNPTWSPDGRQIAFVREKGENNSLFIIPSLGGSEREIARFEGRKIQELVWSSSGRYLAVSAQRAPYSSFSLYLISRDSWDIRELTSPPDYHYGDLYPAFSEDESTLVFVRSILSNVQDIFSVSVKSGETRRLTQKNDPILGLDWDYESDQILFSATHDGISGIWRLDPEGGEPVWQNTKGLDSDIRRPSVSRTGERVMIEQRSSDTNIWRLQRSQRPARLIASTRWESSPAISNDGQRIAFVSDQSGSHELWICDQNGQHSFQLTHMEAGLISMPTWSPNDSLLAFVSWHEGHANIYLVESVGGRPRQFTRTDANEISPRFSNDGNWLYYASDTNGTWQLRKAGLFVPDTLQVMEEPAIAGMEAPDGRSVFFVKPYAKGIWHYSAEVDSSTVLVDDVVPTDSNNWAVAGNGVYFIERSGPSISYFSLTTRRTTQIARLGDLPNNHSFAPSPDGSWFLYSQEEDIKSDIVLLEEE